MSSSTTRLPDKIETDQKDGFSRLFANDVLTIDVQPVTNSDDRTAVAVDYHLKLPYRIEDTSDHGEKWGGLSAILA